jgi:hypothetical protein
VAVIAATLTVTLVYFAPRPAGLALLPGNEGTDRTARWFVQGESGGWSADVEAFRFLENEVPANATVALTVARDTYLYPAWDSRFHRTVLFAPGGDAIPESAAWLVVGPSRSIDMARLLQSGWRLKLSTQRGWRIYRRQLAAHAPGH